MSDEIADEVEGFLAMVGGIVFDLDGDRVTADIVVVNDRVVVVVLV